MTELTKVSFIDKLKGKFHLPTAIAAAIGIGIGAALTALHLNADIATLIGQAVTSLLGG